MAELKRLFGREKILKEALESVDVILNANQLMAIQRKEQERIKMAKAALKTLVGKRGLLQACAEVRQEQTFRKTQVTAAK